MAMMHNPPHPGELIQETIEELGISARKLAQALDVAPSTVQRILKQKAAVSPEMALRLSVVIGSSAHVLLGMQDAYDLWHARENLDLSHLSKLNWA